MIPKKKYMKHLKKDRSRRSRRENQEIKKSLNKRPINVTEKH
ncbi:MAG: hypothetical protein P857_579 [Candidatus Xenolissoclinum pacificiensis L6]|uniref:Uncharacterized protein n=1 Tax=Candidatus Xenolissoclinum pacificiensis L6 TaxID=1401685 RepID=W2V0V7_9RICK|nr:MAG: hypothetical protein P857_579 [Candidatus Xenolissoclinum pacificiensis L6]